MNRIVLSTIVSALMLSGCGSSSNGGDNQGFYVDSAVEGVHYKCDNGKEGTTGADGVFVFTDAKECTFSLAGIKLRTVSGSSLKDGTKILESDPKIAQFLQSLDIDGNAAKNGIKIDAAALKDALEALDAKAGELPTEDELKKLITKLKEDNKDFKGKFVTQLEAMKHVGETAITIATESGASAKASSIAKLKELYATAKLKELFGLDDSKMNKLGDMLDNQTCQSGSVTKKDNTKEAKNCKNGDWTLNGEIYGEDGGAKGLHSSEEFNMLLAKSDITLDGPFSTKITVKEGSSASFHNKTDADHNDHVNAIAAGKFTINGIDVLVTNITISEDVKDNQTELTLVGASVSIGDYSFNIDTSKNNTIIGTKDENTQEITSLDGAFHLKDGAEQAVELTLEKDSEDDTVLVIKIDENGDGKFSEAETLKVELPKDDNTNGGSGTSTKQNP